MNSIELARRALRLIWAQKSLWVFGLFVAGSLSFNLQTGAPGTSNPWPVSLWGLFIAGGLVAIAVYFVLAAWCGAALITSVQQRERGEPIGLRQGLRAGWPHVWRVVKVTLLIGCAVVAGVLVLGAPIAASLLELLPKWTMVLSAPLVLLLVPWLITLFCLQEYALRFAVLERMTAREALRAAYDYLHGRLLDSIRVMLVAWLGRMAGSLIGLGLAAPALLLGFVLYPVVGLVPAVVGGLAVAAPFLLPLTGAIGAFHSTVWTLAFLQSPRHAR